METTLFYNLVPSTYNTNTKVEVDSFCNSFTVVNTGTTDMVVNGVPLAPPVAPALLGEAVQFGGNRAEIFIGRIDLSFTGGAGRCVVTQKIYVQNAGRPVTL